MIALKFGGTAVTPNNLRYVKDIVNRCNCGYVVVSAVGKSNDADIKATDLLKNYYQTKQESYWVEFCNKYCQLVQQNKIDIDMEGLLDYYKGKALTNGYDYCLSLGERLSAKVVARYLNLPCVDASDCIYFCNGKLNYNKTMHMLKSNFKPPKCVIGGFFGTDCNNTTKVFSRGGSDITGSLCAVATHSTLYKNYTDTFGVCKANPSVIANAPTLSNISYKQMYLLSKSGANVLHPEAILPTQRAKVPICVCNFLQDTPCTTVSKVPCTQQIVAITVCNACNGFVTTLLHNLSMQQAKLLCNTLTVNLPSVSYCKVAKNTIKLFSKESILQQVYQFVD